MNAKPPKCWRPVSIRSYTGKAPTADISIYKYEFNNGCGKVYAESFSRLNDICVIGSCAMPRTQLSNAIGSFKDSNEQNCCLFAVIEADEMRLLSEKYGLHQWLLNRRLELAGDGINEII